MLVVIVEHDTGHGPCANCIFVGDDIVAAIKAARDVEKLGYQIYSPERTVSIQNLRLQSAYSKEAQNAAFVLTRRKHGENWEEEWCHPKFKEEYEYRSRQT